MKNTDPRLLRHMPLSREKENVLALAACQSQTSVSATRLWHVKRHQAKRMLSRRQTQNKKTELNMQAKAWPEWQRELWPSARRSLSAFYSETSGFYLHGALKSFTRFDYCVSTMQKHSKSLFLEKGKQAKHQCWQHVARV